MHKMIFSLLLVFFTLVSIGNTVEPIPREQYLEFARESADWTWDNQDSLITKWKGRFDEKSVFGYQPPPYLLDMATIYATLYDTENNPEYAKRVKSILLNYADYRKMYPKWAKDARPDYGNGVPALPDFFSTMRYIKPYYYLNSHGLFTKKEQKQIEEVIAHSIAYLLQAQEWGAMNRSALRAETLAWAVRTLPNHPDCGKWRNYADALRSDNWGQWEIEDAQIYHAVWLYALLGCADANQDLDGLFHTPEMFYYAQYFLNLMCPDGMIPDFGDANWRANWARYLIFFEAAAKAYNDPELKWAASTIAQKFINFDKTTSVGLGYLLFDAYRFGTNDVQPVAPTSGSAEVMDDMVGKKVVLRNGWDENSTYLLVNYRDEGDGGKLFRDYLRDGICVEEEKMTHGHADENSIVNIMYKGSVLLADGGYRDYMPSGPYGAYRQDYFHNRLCVRAEKIYMGQKEGEYRYSPTDHPAIEGQNIIDFIHNSGAYREVRTRKIDFLTFDDFDYSRTRVIDDRMGYKSDRVVVYVKNPELFVVFDVLKATEEEWLTGANLWHTRKIVDQGEHWYDTQIDSLYRYDVSSDNSLLIHFPKNHYRLESVTPERRDYKYALVITEYSGQHFELGQTIGFATVLTPHPNGADLKPLIDRIRYVSPENDMDGMAVEITTDDGVILVGVKNDLRMDMVRDYRRPRYTYEAGKIVYGPMETNGDFFYARKTKKELAFTVVNLTKAIYNGQELYSQQSGYFGLSFDASPDTEGYGKARYWRDVVKVK